MERRWQGSGSRRILRLGVARHFVVALVAVAGVSAIAAPSVSSTGIPDGSTGEVTTTEGAAAVLDVDRNDLPTASATSFTALVSRLGCNNGQTGTVLDPDVSVEADRIVVTFEVEALPPGSYSCPGNDWVPYQVDLGVPIGERPLVDGACLDGDAATTGFCAEGSTRWSDAPDPVTPPSTGTSVPVPPDPQCLPDGSIPPGADRCVDVRTPVFPGPPEADPAHPVRTNPNFTG